MRLVDPIGQPTHSVINTHTHTHTLCGVTRGAGGIFSPLESPLEGFGTARQRVAGEIAQQLRTADVGVTFAKSVALPHPMGHNPPL